MGSQDTTRATVTGTLGPYVQTFPTNSLNGWSGVTTVAAPNYGWVYNVPGEGVYTMQAVNTTGNGVLTY